MLLAVTGLISNNFFCCAGGLDLLRYVKDEMNMTDIISYKDSYGNTLLHTLLKSEENDTLLGKEVLSILIEWGCSLKITDDDGKTPIQCVSQDSFAYRMLKDAEISSSKYFLSFLTC